MTEKIGKRIQAEALQNFCVQVFEKVGVAKEDARFTAEILVASDLRGIFSHGVSHLRRYADGVRSGKIAARPEEKIITETPVSATIDAGVGLGQPVSYRAMRMAIEKALSVGAGFVTVRNSNHFGFAGYYAMMALPHDCIGLALTNASPKVVPTFGRDATLGTNPIALAAPAGEENPFVLDMATSAVALGKVEVAHQLDKPIPEGWAIGADGAPSTDSHRALRELRADAGGGLLPLGGIGELFGGHKGYGLAVGVDILTAVLSGAAVSPATYPKTPEGEEGPANLGHFFGVWRIECFRPVEEFKRAMDDYQRLLRSCTKQPGQSRIYIPGEKEHEATKRYLAEGVPVNQAVAADLSALGSELGVDCTW